VPDFDDVRAAVRRGHLGGLERLLAEGWEVNDSEPWTGANALCEAAYAGNAEMVDLLLRHGADPDSHDNDGYFAYGMRTSRRVRELLLAHGFSAGQWQPTGYAPDTVAQLRVLAPRPVSDTWTEAVTGTDLFVEHVTLDVPGPAGGSTVDVTVDGRAAHAAALSTVGHRLVGLDSGRATITVHCDRFVGEFYVRLYSSTAVDRLDGPRSFWLPDYSF
jgi:hypothetical protein